MHAVQKFLKIYSNYKDIKAICDSLDQLPDGTFDPVVWQQWVHSIHKALTFATKIVIQKDPDMNDSCVSLEKIKNELKEIENLRIDLARNFSLLSQEIRYIFSKIKSCESIECAKDYFDLLDTIQSGLSAFIFEEKIGIPDRLDRFVREFDRFAQDRENYFKKIKNGESTF